MSVLLAGIGRPQKHLNYVADTINIGELLTACYLVLNFSFDDFTRMTSYKSGFLIMPSMIGICLLDRSQF